MKGGGAFDQVRVRVALGDDYEILEHLGQGAYGTVWKGTQKSTGQPVAIKVQRLDPDQNAEQRASRIARFERETRLCATLNHPHIVRIIDQRRFEDCLLMVFEYVPGETLTDFLIRRRALPPSEAVFLMAQVLDAMDAAHARGIVHRDLKPDNIMVVTSGAQPYVKVLDFGIGAYLTDAMASVSVLTRSQEILGTPSYAAPEQLRGDSATSRSDIYAWGLVLLECLTGQRVMDGATMAQVFHRQLSDVDVPLPAALAMHPLGDLLRRALAKSPRNRAADAGRLCADLRRVRLTDLVGAIGGESTARPARTTAAEPGHQPGERRQATVLCCSLGVEAADARAADVETLDTVQRDQLSLCADVVARFGGHVVGRLGNRLVAVFGVPTASDSDARRACRAALELSVQVEARRGVLSRQRGIDLELRVGVHTDIVIVDADGTPSGPAFNVAARIESLAPAGAALVSEATRGLLFKQLRFQPFALPAGVPSPLPLYALPSHVPLASPDLVDGVDPRSPLVGRAAELQALLEHWMAARAGAGCVVLLRGEPGIGKSRLVVEIKDRAQQAGAASFESQCLPEDTNTALHPALAFVRRHFELGRGEPSGGLAELQRAVVASGGEPATAMPVLCGWLGCALPAGFSPLALSGDKQRQILLDVLARLFCSTADQARLVVLEDMHWADPTTRELVGRMTALCATAPVLVLLTARPDAALDTTKLKVIDLGHLDREAVGQLASANAGEAGLPAATLAEIVERTDGIPLYVEELTRALRRAPTGSGAQRVVPASLRDLLSGQLDRLGPAKDTAQLAAAIGRDFDLELLDAVSIRGTDAVQADLDQLVGADMLRQEASLSGARYIFRHALIREAAAGSMLTAQRRAAHHRIAEALEDRGKDGGKDHGAGAAQPARLAWHFEQAGLASKAIDYRLLAGQQSAQASAHQEALENLHAGLALLPELGDPAQRNALEIDLRNLLGGVLIAIRGIGADVVVDCFTRSWELVQVATASPAQMFRALSGLWTFRNARADYAGSQEIGRRLLELAGQQSDPEFHLAAFHSAGQTALLMGDFQGAVDNSQACDRWYDPALQRAQVARYGTDPWLTALSFECIARALTGSIGKARRQLVTIKERSDALGVPALQAGMFGQVAWVELLLGGLGTESDAERSRCLELAGQAARIGNEFGFPFYEAYGRLLLAMAGTLSGEPAAVAGLEQSIGLWRMLGIGAFLSWQLAFLAQGRVVRGEYPAALVSAREALEHCERTGENYGLSESHRVLGLVLGAAGNAQGDWPGAVAAYGRALDVARGQGARWLALRAAFSFASNAAEGHPADAGPARAALAAELKWFHDNGEGPATPLVLASERLLAAGPAPSLPSSTAANPR